MTFTFPDKIGLFVPFQQRLKGKKKRKSLESRRMESMQNWKNITAMEYGTVMFPNNLLPS